jgi:hypothetical protein
LSVAGSAERKGVNTHGSNKESSEETGKEDRKEEIVSLPKHTPFFGLEEKFSSLLFAVSPDI